MLRFCLEQILLLVIFMKLRIITLNSIILIIRELRVQNLSLFNPECRECSLLLITVLARCWVQHRRGFPWLERFLTSPELYKGWHEAEVGRSRIRSGKGGVTPQLKKGKMCGRVLTPCLRARVSMGISHNTRPGRGGLVLLCAAFLLQPCCRRGREQGLW